MPRKRARSEEGKDLPSDHNSTVIKKLKISKPSLSNAAEATRKPEASEESKAAIFHELDNSQASFSSDSSNEDRVFEDVIYNRATASNDEQGYTEEAPTDEDLEFEDVMQTDRPMQATDGADCVGSNNNFELTLDSIPTETQSSLKDLSGGKKGQSKAEKQRRVGAHCMHVQLLLFHNAIRNSWTSDKDVQYHLAAHLTAGVREEILRWQESRQSTTTEPRLAGRRKQKPGLGIRTRQPDTSRANGQQRDWAETAQPGETSSLEGHKTDPLIRLLKVLSAFWRKKYQITAPGIRKLGYKGPARLGREIRGFHKDPDDSSQYGERIIGKEQFRACAKTLRGSRDVGAQLFTALVRSVGLEARLVASLQPIGFGWNKNEDASEPGKTSDKIGPRLVRSANDGNLAAPNRSSRSAIVGESDSELSSALSSDAVETSVDNNPGLPPQSRRYDKDLTFPVYWSEVLSPTSNLWIPIDPLILNVVAYKEEQLQLFEARGAKADKAKQVTAYVIAHSADGSAKDVTVRYLKKHIWPGKTKGARMPPEKLPVYNRKGKVKRYEEFDWFKTVMSGYRRDGRLSTVADRIEESNELCAVHVTRQANDVEGRESLQGYKQSAEFVLKRHLRREEALLPQAKHVKLFTIGKGDKATNEPVYKRKDVVSCKTIESWHKEGREVKAGSTPLKMVPVRAVTLLRKREVEEEERETGEKAQQGLFAKYQTSWIIPPPIKDGVIPKNAYGNIDIYVPSMVPKGACHVPLRGTAKICRQMEIDFAEACTGFEFGNKMAVPIIVGVVIAEQYEKELTDKWQAMQAEKQRKEAERRQKLVLGMWKKMLLGLRVLERFKREYGDHVESHMAHAIKEIETKDKTTRLPRNKKEPPHQKRSRIDDDDRPVKIETVVMGEGGFLKDDHNQLDANTEPTFVEEVVPSDNAEASSTGRSSLPTGKKHRPHRQAHNRSNAAIRSHFFDDASDDCIQLRDPNSSSKSARTVTRNQSGRPSKSR